MSWESSFKGKSVIVTGGGRGIGRAIVVKLHSLGATVFAVSRNPDNLASLKTECPNVHTVAVDLGNWDATTEAIGRIPPVDYLVNNAGVIDLNHFLDVTEENFDTICNVNLKAVINVSQVVAKKMIASGKPGSIVNVSSVAGLKPVPMACVYSALKAGLDHLTKIMAVDLGKHKIRVNCVNPGAVITDMLLSFQEKGNSKSDEDVMERFNARIPSIQKVIGIEEVVGTTLFLLSDVAPMITGSSVAIDGGYCVA
jgi:NAD(P)-dependent dehydrogenase (short-subunit alcohol dehydrogenase family)